MPPEVSANGVEFHVTVGGTQKISNSEGGFAAHYTLASSDNFGSSVASIGDLDGDGISELVVGADGDSYTGAVYVLFLTTSGTASAVQKISNSDGGLSASATGLAVTPSSPPPSAIESA